jgi:hypothetical protein
MSHRRCDHEQRRAYVREVVEAAAGRERVARRARLRDQGRSGGAWLPAWRAPAARVGGAVAGSAAGELVIEERVRGDRTVDQQPPLTGTMKINTPAAMPMTSDAAHATTRERQSRRETLRRQAPNAKKIPNTNTPNNSGHTQRK